MDDPTRLTATDALARIETGSLTASALTAACLDRIAVREPEVHAWAHIADGTGRRAAEVLDVGLTRRPLHGLPIGIKDVIQTRDMPTRHNSALYDEPDPTPDAPCVALLRAAGAVILGKTATVEFAATGRPAPTRNPADLRCTPGGSSSGSAAAVADFHVPLALGTQTGGSIIRPAAYCGIYGVKPTWGLVSREGAKTFATSLDTIGWFARSAQDLGLLYDVLDSEPGGEVGVLSPGAARIAVSRTAVWNQAEPATREALEEAIRRLKAAGAEVVELTLPAMFDDAIAVQATVMKGEARASFLAEYRLHGETLHPNLVGYVENADGISRVDLRDAYDRTAAMRMAFDEIAAPFDAVLTPSVTGEAPEGLASTGSYVFNALWSLIHTPCVNVPGLTGPNGRPVGLTVAGPRFADRRVLAAAAMLGGLIGAETR
ncbi:amidase [Brevundimonas sp.]|uniref:amidase n=1 Tax=Brevundimonas sp. TaxID=1871086 RepID=UPI003D13519E